MSIKKNFLYNIFYQLLNIVIPLITTPYVSRVLRSDGVGRYSYAYAVAYYFVIFCMLGVNNYGNRTIAAVSGDKEERSRKFLSIYSVQLFSSVIVICVYILYACLICDDGKLGWIMLIYIISAALDINWFFFGMEKFGITVARNSAVKLITVICIFIFVKSEESVYIYAFVSVMGMLAAQAILWVSLRKYVSWVKITFRDIKECIKPDLVLFIPVIAISLYKFTDKIMLGAMSTDNEVGYYDSCEKIIQIPLAVVTALGTVMLPRITKMLSQKQEKESLEYTKRSLIFTVSAVSPMCFGIMAVAEEFVPLFYGSGYEKCADIFQILLPSCLFLAFANVIRTQYLIPYKKDSVYIASVIAGAAANLLINALLIPRYSSLGAAFGTLIAEFTVCAVQCFCIRKEFNSLKYAAYSLPFVLASTAMYLILKNFGHGAAGLHAINLPAINLPAIYLLVIKIVIGTVIYGICSLLILLFFRKKKLI